MTQPHSPPALVAETTKAANSSGCLRAILIIFTFSMIAIMFMLWIKPLAGPYLQAAGIPVNAQVVDKATRESCNDGDCHDVYLIRYTFSTLQEQQIQGEEVVDRTQYQQIWLGADWPVVYLRPDPTAHESRYHAVQYVAAGWRLLRWSLVVYLFLFTLIGYEWLLERYFQWKSRLIQGTVTQRWKQSSEEYNYRYSIAYTFPGGVETEATLTLEQYQQVKVGSTIMVRYLPNKPHRSRLEW